MLVVSFFTNGGVPQAGLTPEINIADAVTDEIIETGEMSALAQMTHCYIYDFASAKIETSYIITVDGGATLSDDDRYQFGSSRVSKGGGDYRPDRKPTAYE